MDRFDALKAVVDAQYRLLTAERPAQAALGGEVLLGKHYADQQRGILMLGLNPGVAPNQLPGMICKRHGGNFLLDGLPGVKLPYWTNARKLFCANDRLRASMDAATYSFCSPFRTHDWVSLDADLRDALVQYSRPILRQIVSDCQPSVVIVAGKAARQAFVDILADDVQLQGVISDDGDRKGAYQWAARRARFREHDFTLVRIPHLSRAGSRDRLARCAEWLTAIVC